MTTPLRLHRRQSSMALSALLLAAPLSVLAQAPAPAPAPPPEPDKSIWVSSASLGLTLTRGNSETLMATANIQTEKKWAQNEIRLGADATYGEDQDVKNAESVHGFAQYNRLFTERLFGYLRLDALHDAVADVEYRVTLSPGVGYYFIKNDRTTLSGEVGPGVVFEKQGDEEQTYMTIRFAERFDHKLNDRVRIWQSLEFLPQVDDFDNFILNAEAGIDTALTEKLSLKVFAVNTYDNQPAAGRDKNDLKLVTAVGYKF